VLLLALLMPAAAPMPVAPSPAKELNRLPPEGLMDIQITSLSLNLLDAAHQEFAEVGVLILAPQVVGSVSLRLPWTFT
jgi:hypothetical protein